MQFRQTLETTNGDDLVSDTKFLCGIANSDTTSYPIADMVRSANFAVDRYTALILRADGKWQHDDSNNSATELYDVTTNLVSGTKKYTLSVTWLKILRVRIKDANGVWKTLTPKGRREWTDSELNAGSGEPSEYDLTGNWLYLDKAPNYASTGGLEVMYQRNGAYFTTSSTTTTPGWASPFHRLVSLRMALDYCETNDMDARALKIREKLGAPPSGYEEGSGMERELVNFYALRNVDDRPRMTTKREDYGETTMI